MSHDNLKINNEQFVMKHIQENMHVVWALLCFGTGWDNPYFMMMPLETLYITGPVWGESTGGMYW